MSSVEISLGPPPLCPACRGITLSEDGTECVVCIAHPGYAEPILGCCDFDPDEDEEHMDDPA